MQFFPGVKSIADHQVAGARQLLHQTFDDLAAQHVVKRGAARGADDDGVDLKHFGGVGDGFCGIVGHRPYRNDFDIVLPNGLQRCAQGAQPLFIGHVRRRAGK